MAGERIPFGQGVPNRGTSESWLDDWNQQFRSSSIYQNFMRQNGLPTNGVVQLSRQQQSALEAALRAAGIQIPDGMHIDQGGNLNQKNTLVRNSLIGAGVAAGGLGAAGMAGIGPFSGLAGSGTGATTAGSMSASAGGSLPPIAGGAPWAVTPYATTATMAGTGAGVGAGGGGLIAGLSAADLARLGLAGAGTVGALTQNKQDFNPTTTTSDPGLMKLLQTMQGRLDKSEPLYDSILAMANGLLPTQYQKGGGGMR